MAGRAQRSEADARRLYDFILLGGDRNAVLQAHIAAERARGIGTPDSWPNPLTEGDTKDA